jgi:hypothetical protein
VSMRLDQFLEKLDSPLFIVTAVESDEMSGS